MAGKSKKAKQIRKAADFDLARLKLELLKPKVNAGVYAWDMNAIRNARAMQMLGNFSLPARLAESMRTDAALFVAWLNRLAPQRGIPIEVKAAGDGVRAKSVAAEMRALYGKGGVGVTPETLTTIDDHLTSHGVAFGVNTHVPREDGSRVDVYHSAWPIEHVRWDSYRCTFVTRTEGGPEEIITHGDGRWTVYKLAEIEPWKYGAVLPAALVWGDRAFAVRDRSKAGTAHGNAKVVGTLPEGVAISDPEGQALLDMCGVIASADSPFGVKPFGSLIDYITNNSQAWQIFRETILSNDKDAAKIYLGTDGTTDNSGGNYIKSEVLFGVRNDLVEGNLQAIERSFKSGVIDVCVAINFGDSTLAPSRVYMMPDADEDARREQLSLRTDRFFAAVDAARKSGFDVTADYLAGLAASYGIPVPPIPATSAKAPSVALAPTDMKIVTRVNEARAGGNMGPLVLPDGSPDPDGFISVIEYEAKIMAKIAAAATASTPTAPGAASPQETPSAPATPSAASARGSASQLRPVR